MSLSPVCVCGLDQWISSMLNLITGSAERRSPGACDHLSGSFSLALSLVRGYFQPSPQSERRASAECRESCGSSRLEEEPIWKTCAQEATRDISPIIFCLGHTESPGKCLKVIDKISPPLCVVIYRIMSMDGFFTAAGLVIFVYFKDMSLACFCRVIWIWSRLSHGIQVYPLLCFSLQFREESLWPVSHEFKFRNCWINLYPGSEWEPKSLRGVK